VDTADFQSAARVTSILWKVSEDGLVEQVASPPVALMSPTRTLAPSEAKALDMPAPKPEPPPGRWLGWCCGRVGVGGEGVRTGYDGDFAV